MKRLYALSFYATLLIALIAASIQAGLEENRHLTELRQKGASLLTGLGDSVLQDWSAGKTRTLQRLAERLTARQQISGLAICSHRSLAWLPETHQRSQAAPELAARICGETSSQLVINGMTYLLQSDPLVPESMASPPETATAPGAVRLVLLQSLQGQRALWFASFLRTFLISAMIGFSILFLVATQLRRFVQRYLRYLHQAIRASIAGKAPPPSLDREPLTADLERLTRKILSIKPRSAKILPLERVARTDAVPSWLRSLRGALSGKSLTIIANREPYIHQRRGDTIEIVRPASGLVTALEPILRQLGGTWVAHGSGSADRETADSNNEVALPPDAPTYKLRRVWLSEEEEAGYYLGFANEGLWPLCHLAHTRPVFRLGDWRQYVSVNRKFCEETPASSLDSRSVVLVQDYHFALLPRMLRERGGVRAPKIGLFWHIPWPNPEAFGICPWASELLRGMLGADVVGFHTQYHCNNFLETCDRFLEARVDWERFSVTMSNHETLVRAFPIGIDTPAVRTLAPEELTELKRSYGIVAEHVAVGVDRLDYTKGLLERVYSVERFLEKNPRYIGRFTLAQMGSPSRSSIPAYQHFSEQLQKAVSEVNARFSGPNVPPGYQAIQLIPHHHEWDAIQYFYQLGDVCMVTSLHDGMNLVAKEYVWCQSAERGSLILSRFAGASRELTDAFIVNPYSVEEMADALAQALSLSPAERARRMSVMKKKVQSHNAFHWASNLIQALATEVKKPHPLPQDPQERTRRSRVLKLFASRGSTHP